MICSNCIKKDVCKHKEYLDMYSGLELNKCEYKKVKELVPQNVYEYLVQFYNKMKKGD